VKESSTSTFLPPLSKFPRLRLESSLHHGTPPVALPNHRQGVYGAQILRPMLKVSTVATAGTRFSSQHAGECLQIGRDFSSRCGCHCKKNRPGLECSCSGTAHCEGCRLWGSRTLASIVCTLASNIHPPGSGSGCVTSQGIEETPSMLNAREERCTTKQHAHMWGYESQFMAEADVLQTELTTDRRVRRNHEYHRMGVFRYELNVCQ
jgi:hypothetical protein